MGVCPTNCGTITMIPNDVPCVPQPRLTKPSQFGFYPCNETIPDDATAIEAMLANNSIVWTSPLANFTPQAPTYQDIATDDCKPAKRIVASREIQFQDRYGLVTATGSPAVENKYFDYDFLQDKVQQAESLNYLIRMCNGDVRVAQNINGIPLSADLQVYVDYERSSTQGGESVEMKVGSIMFNGDPLALYSKPLFNIAPDGSVTML